MGSHYNFRVYDAARDLSRVVHESMDLLEVRRVPGLRGQVLASVASIAANIAEGSGAGSQAQLLSYLHVASGSARETRAHLSRAREEGRLPGKLFFRCDNKASVVVSMLEALIQSVEETEARRQHEEKQSAGS